MEDTDRPRNYYYLQNIDQMLQTTSVSKTIYKTFTIILQLVKPERFFYCIPVQLVPSPAYPFRQVQI